MHAGISRALGLPCPTEADVRHLANLAIEQDLADALAFVSSILDEGVSYEAALLDLISPAARNIQAQWLANERSFADATAALHVLEQLVATLRSLTPVSDDSQSK